MAYRDEVLADSPVDYYEMETGTGTDSGSGGKTLTLSGVTTGVSGKLGNGWSFDGVNDYATHSTFPTLTTAFTFEAWVKPTLSGVNDTPTVIRRDGTDIGLLRVRGSSLGVNPGQAEVYIDGTTLLSGSSYRVDDGAWHHLVYTQSGNAAKLYVDGVERATATTGQTSHDFSAGSWYIGSANGTGEWYKGAMDEVAVYNTALSPTRITAHYNAANGVAGGYTAQAMTASATTVDATGRGNIQTLAVTDDAHVIWNQTSTNYGSSTTLNMQSLGVQPVFVKSAAQSGSEYETARTLYLYKSFSGSVGSIEVYSVLANWSEGTITYGNKPSASLVRTVSGLPSGAGYKAIDITGADIGYGVMLAGNTSFDSTEGTNPPYVVLATGPQAHVNPTAAPMTASENMPDPAVEGGDTVSASGQPMTASATFVSPGVSATSGDAAINAAVMSAAALAVDPVVFAEHDFEHEAEPMAAAATWPTTTGIAIDETLPADPMTAVGTTVDATVDTQRGPRIAAVPMTATSNWKAPALVNDEEIVASEVDDKYFQRVYAASPAYWFRMNTKSAIQIDRMNPLGLKSYIEGDVIFGRNDGPDGRHNLHFPGGGGWIRQDEAEPETGLYTGGTLEFSFRTTKENTFIMLGYDRLAGTQNSRNQTPIEIYLKDGKINYKAYNWDTTVASEFTGFKNLADGEWHQVIIVSASESGIGNRGNTEVYIDGEFEIRRRGGAQFAGYPDYIGNRPNFLPSLPWTNLPGSLHFEGDISEVAYYRYILSEDEIPWHYYLFMGWTPIQANPMEAFAFTPADSRGRGNQKRALSLWWPVREDAYNIGGGPWNNRPNMDPLLSLKGTFSSGPYANYMVFAKGVITKSSGEAYYDIKTDLPRLIDLENDIDIEDYDLIVFNDWPDEGYEYDLFGGYENFSAQVERLVEQLRWANDKGISLMVTQPRLAADLGIVDRVEWAPSLREWRSAAFQGNADGLYDYGSAVKFPWNIAAENALQGGLNVTGSELNGTEMNTDPGYLSNKAYFYGDTHKNDRFRVRALIEGLTDIPSYMYEESIYNLEYDAWGDQLFAMKYLHRMDGLQIGDEFIFFGSDRGWLSTTVSADFDVIRTGRWYGTWATPIANVKAGTVVTTFGSKHWVGEQEVDNPYKDYATTIVLRPGDYLNGTRVGGKIFVNFSEQPNRYPLTVPVQVLPGSAEDLADPDLNSEWPVDYKPDTAAQREWEYSGTRLTVNVTREQQVNPYVQVTMPDGSVEIVRAGSGSTNELYMTRYGEIFPVTYYPMFTMVFRGWLWLSDTPEIGEGDVFPSVQPLTATAEMPNPTVTAQKDGGYTAQPMRALAQVTKVAEDETGDAQVVTLAMEATAEFTGFSRVISAAPMTATAELVESFDMVHTSGEQVVLTLHGVDAVLYLKEEE